MAEIPKITVNLENLALGHLEALESGKFAKILPVFDEIVHLEGVPDEKQHEALRALHWTALVQITKEIMQAIQEATNPETDGKN